MVESQNNEFNDAWEVLSEYMERQVLEENWETEEM